MSQSRPICERLHRALVLFKKSRRYLPRSAFGQAIDYALSNWPLLGIYLEDGRIQIDNNLVENCIRPTALGKKNWLFLGMPMPVNAAPSFTPLSRVAAAAASIPTPTCATCSPGFPQ